MSQPDTCATCAAPPSSTWHSRHQLEHDPEKWKPVSEKIMLK